VTEKKRILVVEDTPIVRTLITDVLEYHGYEVVCARNGAEGVSKAAGGAFDLVLMDIHMPVMDGYAALARLRENEATKGAIVMALTSSTTEEDLARIAEAGFDGCIAKPVDIRALPIVVRNSMRR